jgi:hypothetical protein
MKSRQLNPVENYHPTLKMMRCGTVGEEMTSTKRTTTTTTRRREQTQGVLLKKEHLRVIQNFILRLFYLIKMAF